MANLSGSEPLDRIGNASYLEKQDKLREIGIDIATSQIVVVGGQSSGKSSLLENLTGFSFPRGQGLCTRYATQITLRRNAVKGIVISIIPWHEADQDHKARLREFRRELDDFDGKNLVQVIEEANTTMGIRCGAAQDDLSLPMFSNDILKIEICGPEQPHLTVIDVPGLFEVTDEGKTTERDKTMVRQMVQRYMENDRTIVLAVLSCLSDRATEGVLQFAKKADPEGVRTVGVLTKADLANERTVREALLQLLTGNTLKLGYFLVRNRGADDDSLDISECRLKEKELFGDPGWADHAKLGRTGVDALRVELEILLAELARRELPNQRAEVVQRLSDCRAKLEAMGGPRDNSASQRECLIKLASKFERIVRDALDGRYDGSPIFKDKAELKLATAIVGSNEGFSDLMWTKGHTWKFANEDGANPVRDPAKYEARAKASHEAASSIPELQHIVSCDEAECAAPSEEPIMDHIKTCYRESRGPELGTFGGSLLAMMFRAQAKKWRTIVMTHVDLVIVTVHNFIEVVLKEVIADSRMRKELWDSVLLEKLQEAYGRAKAHAQFLLDLELDRRPSTYNHCFNDNLQKARVDRLTRALDESGTEKQENGSLVPQDAIGRLTNKSNAEQVEEDIHDILEGYYDVSRERFVDVICRQVVEHFLLDGTSSPLKVLIPELIGTMSDSQLDRIAGEAPATRRERERLNVEIQGLEAATKILRG